MRVLLEAMGTVTTTSEAMADGQIILEMREVTDLDSEQQQKIITDLKVKYPIAKLRVHRCRHDEGKPCTVEEIKVVKI